ncbi:MULTISPECIES: hypothetical protein [unclassified Microcella]|uniref:hypothetical protein n=1 Tax=unclassified Microcella TaxID=2630066 RepID=UPI000700573C|nr:MULTISPECIES: hypothetical protein [unclassified Microcella]KQV24706.1 hypothetical protein ASC54_09350 [Yonghaparkia sp. Root332]KRF30995.1 hypothetical protein ASG83_09180 [Yonghaparkia sp. Soil809]
MRARPPRPAARTAGRVAVAALSAALAAAGLTGCAGATGSDSPPRPAPVEALPASTDAIAVEAEVYRTRIDAARDGIQLSVTNEGDAALALDGARLESPLLSAALERIDDAVIPAGATRDLPMTLVEPRCPASPEGRAPDAPEAVLLVPLADGSVTELRVPTTDRIGQWAAWVESACFAQAVAERVELSVRADGGAGGTIGVELVVRPREGPVGDRGGAEVVRLMSVSGTVLLGALDAAGERAEGIPLDVVVDPASPTVAPIVVPLRFSPNRCDAHAIADDKQGTLFRVGVALGERTGTVTIVSDDATKEALYAALTASCAAND